MSLRTRLVAYTALTAVGVSIGLAVTALHHDRQTSRRNEFLTGRVLVLAERLKQAHGQEQGRTQEVIILPPLGDEHPSNPSQTDFCPVNLAICLDVARDSEAQRKSCENACDSSKSDLKQCKRNSWITLTLFRRLKEALGKTTGGQVESE